MKVLEIYGAHCWSLRGATRETIRKLRAAVAIVDERARALALSGIADGQAFRFVGNPLKLEFACDFFDEVNVNFEPADVTTRIRIRQCVRRWSKNGVKVPEIETHESVNGLRVSKFPQCLATLLRGSTDLTGALGQQRSPA